MARIVFTEPAEYDLLDIEYYIFADLCNPSFLLLRCEGRCCIHNQGFI